MDRYEKIGFTCLGVLAILYVIAMLAGMILAFPFGLLGLIALLGIGSLLLKVIKERVNNKEDDYYSKNINQ